MNPSVRSLLDTPRHRSWIERLVAHPLAMAAILAVVYTVVCSFYIVYSDRIAHALASPTLSYEQIQTYKGLAFVILSGLMLFGFSFWIFQLLEGRRRQILQQAQALVNAESRAQAGIFASSVAHDINNILTVLFGRIELLSDDDSLGADSRDEVTKIGQTAGRLSELVRSLAAIGREQAPGEREVVDLGHLLADVINLAASHRLIKQRALQYTGPTNLTCRANPQTVSRAVLNLLVNAADATAPGGRIELSAAIEAERDILIAVDDDGPGVSAEARDLIFRDFYTTKTHGHGLGLVSVKYCAREHAGTWGLDTSSLGGARFYLRLPRDLDEASLDSVAS
jgi:two-component system sensor histidine kinase HydH